MLNLAVNNEFGSTDLVRAFCRNLMIRHGLKHNTIYNVEKILRRVLRIIGTQQPPHCLVEDYVASMYEAKYSYAHIVNTIRAIRRFMDFIGDPIEIGYPKRPKRTIKDTLTEAEVAIIIAACRTVREEAILVLLAYSGVRNEELCNVRLKHIDFGANRMHVDMGKGSKDRNIPISGECTKVLLRYLAVYPRQPNEYLFATARGNRPFRPHALRLMVTTIVKRTGINKRVTPHLFRHSLASNMIARGASPIDIQGLLGHSFIETTMIYIRSSDKRLASSYHVYSPSYT